MLGVSKSVLERKFARDIEALCQEDGVPLPERELVFHPRRKWRFDFAWPDVQIGVEVEGGVWTRGRHTRSSGFIDDCEKYNAAAELGWRVFRFPGTEVQSGDAACMMIEVLKGEYSGEPLLP